MISFDESAFEDYLQWAKEDKKIFGKINRLITDTARAPFKGIGKPESLKGNLSGCWSRCITDEHRLVYKVLQDQIIITSCKYHYK